MTDKIMSIIVLNWNRLDYSKRTIEAIIAKTTVPHVLCLVDNNSAEESGVREYLSSITESNTNAQKVIHAFNDRNLGVSLGRNSGIFAVEKEIGDKNKYIFNIDDDVIVPDNYDKEIVSVCDGVPKLGITGINVEPIDYPVVNINNINVRVKRTSNLGGAALALKRSVFLRVGYYGFGRGTIYGLEDSLMRQKMDMLGLISAYIVPKGLHIDVDKDKAYRLEKNKAHKKGSIQLQEFAKCVAEMKKTGNIYTPYVPENFKPVDETIFTNELIMKDR